MEITEVKVILKEGPDKKLKAYATLTLDNSFVVRNVKVIKGNKGLFVAMPSRKMREACPKCNYKNTIRSRFCNQCGAGLPISQPQPRQGMDEPRQSEHRDIAHPITLECREYIQKKVLDAYEAELNKTGAEIHRTPPQEKPSLQPEPEKPREAEKTSLEGEGDIQL